MKLIEGVDYILEGKCMVLTAEFLLKRGYCCNYRCQNCPYKKEFQTLDKIVNNSNKIA
jgi:Family of unknown function (DUF5522)